MRPLLILAMLFGAALPACGQSTRDKTIHATYVAVEAARVGFSAFDESHQHELVQAATSLESGKAALEDWKAKRAHITDVFGVTYRALATAAIVSDDQSLSALVSAAAILSQELTALGVKLGARQRPLSSPYATQYAWGVQ